MKNLGLPPRPIPPGPGPIRPDARIVAIVREHLDFARTYPDKTASVARRLGVSPDDALAVVIAEHICEEFEPTRRASRLGSSPRVAGPDRAGLASRGGIEA